MIFRNPHCRLRAKTSFDFEWISEHVFHCSRGFAPHSDPELASSCLNCLCATLICHRSASSDFMISLSKWSRTGRSTTFLNTNTSSDGAAVCNLSRFWEVVVKLKMRWHLVASIFILCCLLPSAPCLLACMHHMHHSTVSPCCLWCRTSCGSSSLRASRSQKHELPGV